MTDQPQAGWYPDPAGDVTKLRWWDGAQWTDNYTEMPVQQPQPQPQPQPIYEQQAYEQQAYGQQAQPSYAQQQPYGAQPQAATVLAPGAVYAMNETDRTLRLIAFILNILTTVAVCWAIIPLAWCIPMTVHSWSLYKGTKPNTIAFGVCNLIFCSTIGGILLLISQKDA